MLALTQPARVERLILRSPPAFGADILPARRRLGSLASMCRYLGVPLTAAVVGMLLGNAEQARTIQAQRRAALLPAIRGLLFDGAQIPTDRLREIHAPTLIFSHPDDALHPLRSGEILRAAIPGASLDVAPSAEHWKQNSDVFCQLVASFVKGRSSSPSLTATCSAKTAATTERSS